MFKPLGMEPGKRYPVFFEHYGGPHAQQVKRAWMGNALPQYWVSKGWIYFQIDNRGSANRGTLFLDEIGEIPFELQSRLLRILQSGDFNRVGSAQPEQVDVRVIAATNRDLEREVEQRRFREDLYFRLSTVTLKVPPLRERSTDVVMLADHFLRAYAGRRAVLPPRLSNESTQLLLAYHFPGNVRELEGEMARLAAMCPAGEEIPASALNERIARRKAAIRQEADIQPMSLAEMEKKLIQVVLQHTAGTVRTRPRFSASAGKDFARRW